MKLVLADVEERALADAAQRLRAPGRELIEVRCDVSRPEEVARLAEHAMNAFGAVHVVCNNAGVADTSGAAVWEASLEDWQWVMGVNMWGVVHGIRTFVPILLRQEEGYVVNTASSAGLVAGALGSYSVTKHAVVALSESLRSELTAINAHIGVSVVCPSAVATRIMEADRNRPSGPLGSTPINPSPDQILERLRQNIASSTPPSEIAARVVEAMRAGRFYVLPHSAVLEQVRGRLQAIEADTPHASTV
jgi:NAD(P)-dependent dehydrogenase (short-subunit alcohol dehydrogenase family)